jgi:hypothetical protein
MLAERAAPPEPTIIGGPLHAIGARLGLVHRGKGDTARLGLAIAGTLWGGLVLLAVVQGRIGEILTLSVVAGHVRLLVAIPLFFLCERWLEPRLRFLIEGLRRSGIAPAETAPALDREVARFNRLIASPLAESVLLALAVAAAVVPAAAWLGVVGTTAAVETADRALAAQWYWLVCLPVFRFLVFRWVWRIAVWIFFLWRLSRLRLRLIPTHPDRAAGLGYLAVTQSAFAYLIAAISAVAAAGVAEEVATTGAPLAVLYHPAIVLVLLVALVFIAPLWMFSVALDDARAKGLEDYMDLATEYVMRFDGKWLRRSGERTEELLGSPDLQSLADLGNSVKVVDEMRIVPLDERTIWLFGAAIVLPMLPLAFLWLPLDEVAERVIGRLLGG